MTTNDVNQVDASKSANEEHSITSLGDNVRPIRQSDVVITEHLSSRTLRPRDLLAEAEALRELAGLIALDPRRAVQRALELAVTLCDAGSAGLSILERGPDGAERFRWEAIAGPLDCHVGGVTPRDFSPCGLCLDAGRTILVDRPFSVFAYFNDARQPLLEGLVSPLQDSGLMLGTIWIVHHDVTKRFDAEDARVAESLAAQMTLALKRCHGTVAFPGTPHVGASPASFNPFVRKLAAYGGLSNIEMSLLERVSADAHPLPARADLVGEGELGEGELGEGEPAGGLVLVMEGMACRYTLRASGGRQITAFLLPGDFCDVDVALLRRMNHAIVTVSPTQVARIPRETIADLAASHPAIANALRSSALADEATLREWLMNVGGRSALERIAHLLCELLFRLQVVGLAEADGYDLPVTQIDLADTTGLSAVHVNRTIQALRRRGLIALSGRALRILDLPALMALAEFRPAYLHLAEISA